MLERFNERYFGEAAALQAEGCHVLLAEYRVGIESGGETKGPRRNVDSEHGGSVIPQLDEETAVAAARIEYGVPRLRSDGPAHDPQETDVRNAGAGLAYEMMIGTVVFLFLRLLA